MTFISTRDLSGLPEIDPLKRLLQSIATLDLILSLGDGGYYTFQSRWGRNEQLAAMDDGSGDHFFAHFSRRGCFLVGFDHESEMSPYQSDPPQHWPGLFDDVPQDFSASVKEPAFDIEASTFVIWRRHDDDCWQTSDVEFPDGDDPDGSELMLSILDGNPATFAEWAEDYYEVEIELQVVADIYEQLPLTAAMLEKLNDEAALGRLHNDLAQIGYPST